MAFRVVFLGGPRDGFFSTLHLDPARPTPDENFVVKATCEGAPEPGNSPIVDPPISITA
jgi:hypothetical protein